MKTFTITPENQLYLPQAIEDYHYQNPETMILVQSLKIEKLFANGTKTRVRHPDINPNFRLPDLPEQYWGTELGWMEVKWKHEPSVDGNRLEWYPSPDDPDGDVLFPTSENWKPKAWIRISDIPQLPYQLSRNLRVNLDGMGTPPRKAKDRGAHEDLFWLIKMEMMLPEETIEGMKLYRMFDSTHLSLHIDISGWPVRYVPRQYLKWFVGDRRVGSDILRHTDKTWSWRFNELKWNPNELWKACARWLEKTEPGWNDTRHYDREDDFSNPRSPNSGTTSSGYWGKGLVRYPTGSLGDRYVDIGCQGGDPGKWGSPYYSDRQRESLEDTSPDASWESTTFTPYASDNNFKEPRFTDHSSGDPSNFQPPEKRYQAFLRRLASGRELALQELLGQTALLQLDILDFHKKWNQRNLRLISMITPCRKTLLQEQEERQGEGFDRYLYLHESVSTLLELLEATEKVSEHFIRVWTRSLEKALSGAYMVLCKDPLQLMLEAPMEEIISEPDPDVLPKAEELEAWEKVPDRKDPVREWVREQRELQRRKKHSVWKQRQRKEIARNRGKHPKEDPMWGYSDGVWEVLQACPNVKDRREQLEKMCMV